MTTVSPWYQPSDSPTFWVSGNVIDKDGVDHSDGATTKETTFKRTTTGAIANGPFSADPTTLGYDYEYVDYGFTVRLEPDEMVQYGMPWDFDVAGDAPPTWTGELEWELPDGTVTRDTGLVTANAGVLLPSAGIDVAIGPGLFPIVADRIDTPYSDAGYSTQRAAVQLGIGPGVWDVPPSRTVLGGPLPGPPSAYQAHQAWDGTAVVWTAAIVGPTFTGAYANGKYGLQGATGGVDTAWRSGSPVIGGHGDATPWFPFDGAGSGIVAWRATYRPIRYRFVLDGRPPLAHRQRRDGTDTAGPQLAQIDATGARQPLAWRQNTP